jgi:hypothetical protein
LEKLKFGAGHIHTGNENSSIQFAHVVIVGFNEIVN